MAVYWRVPWLKVFPAKSTSPAGAEAEARAATPVNSSRIAASPPQENTHMRDPLRASSCGGGGGRGGGRKGASRRGEGR